MRITSKQLAQTLFDLTDGKSNSEAEKVIADFAHFLNKGRKVKLAEKIIGYFSEIFNEKKGIIETEAVTAQRLENSQIQKAKNYINKKYQAKEVVLKNTIDESIKGGIILKIGDEVTDGSVKGNLNSLRNLITR